MRCHDCRDGLLIDETWPNRRRPSCGRRQGTSRKATASKRTRRGSESRVDRQHVAIRRRHVERTLLARSSPRYPLLKRELREKWGIPSDGFSDEESKNEWLKRLMTESDRGPDVGGSILMNNFNADCRRFVKDTGIPGDFTVGMRHLLWDSHSSDWNFFYGVGGEARGDTWICWVEVYSPFHLVRTHFAALRQRGARKGEPRINLELLRLEVEDDCYLTDADLNRGLKILAQEVERRGTHPPRFRPRPKLRRFLDVIDGKMKPATSADRVGKHRYRKLLNS